METLDNNTSSEKTISGTNTFEEVKATEENVPSRSKKKHVSALQAAAQARSAIDHVHPHSLSGLTSRFDHTGTNPSYGNL